MITAGLWLWATLAGLDLASVLQSLLSRPLVVGAGAGMLLGDPEAGLRIGAVLELFALDVVPVGSVRYPDFGAATAAAVMIGAGRPWPETLGWAAGFGLLMAMAAGLTLPLTRRINATVVRAFITRLEAGDRQAVETVQWRCLAHDTVRSGLVAALALAFGAVVRTSDLLPGGSLGRGITAVAVSGALWAAVHGVVVTAKASSRWVWAAAGLAGGVVVALVR